MPVTLTNLQLIRRLQTYGKRQKAREPSKFGVSLAKTMELQREKFPDVQLPCTLTEVTNGVRASTTALKVVVAASLVLGGTDKVLASVVAVTAAAAFWSTKSISACLFSIST